MSTIDLSNQFPMNFDKRQGREMFKCATQHTFISEENSSSVGKICSHSDLDSIGIVLGGEQIARISTTDGGLFRPIVSIWGTGHVDDLKSIMTALGRFFLFHSHWEICWLHDFCVIIFRSHQINVQQLDLDGLIFASLDIPWAFFKLGIIWRIWWRGHIAPQWIQLTVTICDVFVFCRGRERSNTMNNKLIQLFFPRFVLMKV